MHGGDEPLRWRCSVCGQWSAKHEIGRCPTCGKQFCVRDAAIGGSEDVCPACGVELGTPDPGGGRRFYPFPNGTAFERWNAENCDRCADSVERKRTPDHSPDYTEFTCPIERALSSACVSDGTVDPAVMRAIGSMRDNGDVGIYAARCSAFRKVAGT